MRREQARAEQERNLREKRQAFNALVLLLGTKDAGKVIPERLTTQPMLVQDIAPDTTSTLIERRPDILAAEHRLQARNADIGAARAAFFPRISLTGSFGTSSAQMSGLFDGGSRSWSFVPNLSLPLFDAGRNSAGLSLAEARKDSAVAAYEGTIQTAFREVADALAQRGTIDEQIAAQTARVGAANVALRISDARYRAGVESFLNTLDSQRSAYAAQQQLVTTRLTRISNLVELYRSLGGGLE